MSAINLSSNGCRPKSAKVRVGASVTGASEEVDSVIKMGRCRGLQKEQERTYGQARIACG
ncbi:Uncharacterised protein [Bordetella pertussis]|nr:Uncharacterised protein [Bordetella pertussis]